MDKPIKKRFQPNESDVKRYKKMGFNKAYDLWEQYHEQELLKEADLTRMKNAQIHALSEKVERLTLTEAAIRGAIVSQWFCVPMLGGDITDKILSLQKGKE